MTDRAARKGFPAFGTARFSFPVVTALKFLVANDTPARPGFGELGRCVSTHLGALSTPERHSASGAAKPGVTTAGLKNFAAKFASFVFVLHCLMKLATVDPSVAKQM